MFGVLGGLGALQPPSPVDAATQIMQSHYEIQSHYEMQWRYAQIAATQQGLLSNTPETVFNCLSEVEKSKLSPAAILAFSSGAFPDELVDELRLIIGRRILP